MDDDGLAFALNDRESNSTLCLLEPGEQNFLGTGTKCEL